MGVNKHSEWQDRAFWRRQDGTNLGVDESEDVSQDVTDVRQTQQHERNAEHGVGDTHQPTPHRLRRNVAVACG